VPGHREFHRGLAHRIGLLEVCLRRDVARRALQIIRHGPMHLEPEAAANKGGDDRRHAAELSVAKGVPEAGVRQELAIGALQPL